MEDAGSCSGDSEVERMQSLALSSLSSNSPQGSPSSRSNMGKRWSLASASSGYDSSSAFWFGSYLQAASEDSDHLTVNRAYSDHDMSDRSSRSRSASPFSASTPQGFNVDMVTLQELFRDRYPKAIEEMEGRLGKFKQALCLHQHANHQDAGINFLAGQLLSLADDLLGKLEAKLVTLQVFQSMSEKLKQLHEDNIRRGPTDETMSVVHKLLHQMSVIIARPKGLLECMELDTEALVSQSRSTSTSSERKSVNLEDPESPLPTLGCPSHLVDYVRQCLTPKDASPRDRRLSVKSGCDDEVLPEDVQPKADDFDQIKLISNGAYGSVYLVRHKERQQLFAMKKVAKSNVLRKKKLDQVYAERNILTFANNPFVVGLWCTFETKKHFCMVLEYVEGGDCAALLKAIGGPLPTELARLYVAETVLALEYLHSYGIVHRDLKPDNMLITSVGHVKLTDFGLSKVGLMSFASSVYEEGVASNQVFVDEQVFGTPDYIAPEVILRQGYGAPVDWWALGVVLYQFLVGIAPFYGESVEDLFEQITDDAVVLEFPKDVPFPTDAQAIIERLLVRDPNERLGSLACSGAAEVKHHSFFTDVDWRNMLLQKAEFMPQLENEEDTSYFDPRTDRYDHTLVDDDDDDADADEDCPYGNFMSMSPSFSRSAKMSLSRRGSINRSDSDLSDFSSLETSSSPGSPYNVTAWRSHELETSSQHGSVTSTSTGPASVASAPEHDQIALAVTRAHSTSSHPPPEAIVVVPPPGTAVSLSTIAGTSSLGSLAAFNRHSGLDRPIRLSRRRQSLDEGSGHARMRALSLSQRLSDSGQGAGRGCLAPSLTGQPTIGFGQPMLSSLTSMASSSRTIVPPLVSPMSSRQLPSAPSGGHAPTRQQNSLGAGNSITLQAKGRDGMTVTAIRVFLGTSDNYVVQHLIKDVVEGSASWNSGVRPNTLITHIDGIPVVGLKHTDVVQLLNSNRKTPTTLLVVALSSTSISRKTQRRQSANAKRLTSKHEKKLTKASGGSSGVGSGGRLVRSFWRGRRNSRVAASECTDSPVTLTSPASPLAFVKSSQSLHQRLQNRITQFRRPSVTSLVAPMSPLATISQTSPQRRASIAHTTLRRTASVGSPMPNFLRPGARPAKHDYQSLSYRHQDVPTCSEPSPPPEASSEPHTPLRRRLRRSEVLSTPDEVRKSSE